MIYHAISKLPFPALYFLSDIIAFLLFHVFRYRRQLSLDNLKRSFPDKSSDTLTEIQKSAYLHLTDSFLEMLKASKICNEEIDDRVNLENFEEIERLLAKDQSIFFLTAHTAPSEWVAFKLSLKCKCIIDPVFKPIHSKSLNKFIYAARSRHQGTPIPYKKLAKDVLLRKGAKRSIALLADLEPRSRDHFLELNFLNQSTRFFLGSEKIIKLTQLPVFFIGIKKLSRGHYQAYAEKISDHPKALPAGELTRKYVQCVEKLILENPSAWLWTHKRWKHNAI